MDLKSELRLSGAVAAHGNKFFVGPLGLHNPPTAGSEPRERLLPRGCAQVDLPLRVEALHANSKIHYAWRWSRRWHDYFPERHLRQDGNLVGGAAEIIAQPHKNAFVA